MSSKNWTIADGGRASKSGLRLQPSTTSACAFAVSLSVRARLRQPFQEPGPDVGIEQALGPDAGQHLRDLARGARRHLLRRPSCVTPPVWKALATLGCCSSRDAGEGGSTRHTSSPRPPDGRCPARPAARLRRGCRRAVDRNSAPGFMRAKAHASIRPRVASSSGQCRLRMSARQQGVEVHGFGAARADFLGGQQRIAGDDRQAEALRDARHRRPISPMPTRPMARPSISRPISASRLRAVPARRAAPDSSRRLTSDSSSA